MKTGCGILCGFFVLALALSLLVCCNQKPETVEYHEEEALEKSLFIFTDQDDFSKGQNEGTQITSYGNGAITLAIGAERGSYTSPIINTSPFEYMILSWNASTPEDSNVTIHGRVRVNGQWSQWLSWGTWSTSSYADANGNQAMPGSALASQQSDGIANVATDELYVKGSSGETANAFQYRLILHSGSDKSNQPHIRLVASTIRNTLDGQSIPAATPANASELEMYDQDLDVPTYSQAIRDPVISNSICSPTSVAMALAYFGHNISPEQSAWFARDYIGNMFGNWSFNVASAASFDLSGYVAYFIQEDGDPWLQVKEQIAAGNPVIVSVRYQNPQSSESYPVVEGVPISSTGGHLVLVRGFTWVDEVEYIIVNDSAARDNEEVYRKYRADQFAKAWVKRVAYVIYPDSSEIGRPSAPTHIDASLAPAGKPMNGIQNFELFVADEAIPISDTNIRAISVSYNEEKSTYVGVRPSISATAQYLSFATGNKPGTYTYVFIANDKKTYRAVIDWP